MVARLSDDDIWRLNRGGHDPHKIYAAYDSAVKHKGQPTVILAKTIKGYAIGAAGEGRLHRAGAVKGTLVAGLGLFRWVLVSPNKFQPSEWAFVNDLSKRLPAGSATRVMAWDQAGLDSRLSRNTDLVDYLQRGDDLERLIRKESQDRWLDSIATMRVISDS